MRTLFLISLLSILTSLYAVNGEKYGKANTRDLNTLIPAGIEPAFDHWMRDTYVTLAPDGYYYMTGTTATPDREFEGEPHCWDWNDGIYLWRSNDLNNWEPMGLVWSFDKDATWQKDPRVFGENEKYNKTSLNGDPLDNKFRAAWAHKIHYIKSLDNWFIVSCVNDSDGGRGSFILKSTSGKAEGPYINIEGNKEGAIFPQIDGNLFEDTDGTVYFIGHSHYIARMKLDMSGFDEELRTLEEEKFTPEPYIEGVSIFKYDNKYHLVQAIWSFRGENEETYIVPTKEFADKYTRYSYDCVIATSDNIYGPYSKRYNSITGGGHNSIFQDKNGEWWATMFFNPRGAQADEYKQTCRPGLIPMKYEKNKFSPDHSRVKNNRN